MLDNPIWHSLTTRHARLAIGRACARRYPPHTAPFAAVPEPSRQAEADLRELVQPGEKVGILNVIPPLGEGWAPVKDIDIHQYVWPSGLQVAPESGMSKLGEEHIEAMLELTALVYPAYFRPDTARLGDYYGILVEGRLAAMAGIRMAMNGYQELSAICTHPDYRGKGYAGRLTRHLVNQVQSQGEVAFLHTESDNPAQLMYEKLGFELRKVLPFRVVERRDE